MAARASFKPTTCYCRSPPSAVHCHHFIEPQLQTQNRFWTNKPSSSTQERCSLPQGSTLSLLLFNIYISDLPTTISHQYGYADDLALFDSNKSWERGEKSLSKDMKTLANFLHSWRLKLSTEKTTSTPFHLCNREAQRQLFIGVNGNILPHSPHRKYLGVKLDRQLTYIGSTSKTYAGK